MAKLTERKRELRRSESGQVLRKQSLRNIGMPLYVLGLFVWYYKEFQDQYSYSGNFEYYVAAIMIIVSLILIYRYTKFNALLELYNHYYYLIYQNEMFTVKKLAVESDKSEKRVIQEINTLIEEGFLKNIHVNEKFNTIGGAFVTSVKEQILRKVIRCSGCGARNEVVENETRECEYCGRKLVYEHD